MCKVTQALKLGKVYPRGIHDIGDSEVKHPHFAQYLKCGYIIALEEKSVPTLVEVEAKELEAPKEGKSKKKKKE